MVAFGSASGNDGYMVQPSELIDSDSVMVVVVVEHFRLAGQIHDGSSVAVPFVVLIAKYAVAAKFEKYFALNLQQWKIHVSHNIKHILHESLDIH